MALGLVGEARNETFAAKQDGYAVAITILRNVSLSPNEAARHGVAINKDGVRRSGFDILGFPNVTFDTLRAIWPELAGIGAVTAKQVEIDAKYAVYLDRQAADISAFRRDESMVIPADLDFASLPGLSTEIRMRLTRIRPSTMGQAGRIEGMTPTALTLLAAHVRRPARRAS